MANNQFYCDFSKKFNSVNSPKYTVTESQSTKKLKRLWLKKAEKKQQIRQSNDDDIARLQQELKAIEKQIEEIALNDRKRARAEARALGRKNLREDKQITKNRGGSLVGKAFTKEYKKYSDRQFITKTLPFDCNKIIENPYVMLFGELSATVLTSREVYGCFLDCDKAQNWEKFSGEKKTSSGTISISCDSVN